ncbi:hypothetical protein D3C73_537610 [compost metagenome]
MNRAALTLSIVDKVVPPIYTSVILANITLGIKYGRYQMYKINLHVHLHPECCNREDPPIESCASIYT